VGVLAIFQDSDGRYVVDTEQNGLKYVRRCMGVMWMKGGQSIADSRNFTARRAEEARRLTRWSMDATTWRPRDGHEATEQRDTDCSTPGS
jgi:hypothetical protein